MYQLCTNWYSITLQWILVRSSGIKKGKTFCQFFYLSVEKFLILTFLWSLLSFIVWFYIFRKQETMKLCPLGFCLHTNFWYIPSQPIGECKALCSWHNVPLDVICLTFTTTAWRWNAFRGNVHKTMYVRFFGCFLFHLKKKKEKK